jgi:hypothetical protein
VTVALKLKAAGTATKRKGRPKAVKQQGRGFFPLTPAERKAATDRIVAAVGAWPDDEIELLADINSAHRLFEWHLEVKHGEAGRGQVTRIRKGIENCVKLIESHPWIKEIAEPHDLPRLLATVRAHEQWQTARLRERKNRRAKRVRGPTPLEWLIGVELGQIYKKRFRSAATWHRVEDGTPQGSVIYFIEAVTAELNLDCSRALIARALTRLKSVRDSSTAAARRY